MKRIFRRDEADGIGKVELGTVNFLDAGQVYKAMTTIFLICFRLHREPLTVLGTQQRGPLFLRPPHPPF